MLNQALLLTFIGMTMTFAALGLLVVGMYVLTAFITDRPRRKAKPTEEVPVEGTLVKQVADVALHLAQAATSASTAPAVSPPQAIERPPLATVVTQSATEERRRAAAVAVALALAEAPLPSDDRQRAAAAAVIAALCAFEPPSTMTPPSTPPSDAWNHHARLQHLTRRQRLARP